MSEAWRSASIGLKIYIASNTKIYLKNLSHQASCCTMMVDELGFKVGFPKSTKVNRCMRRFFLKFSVLIEAYLQPCICDENLGHVSIVKET